MATVFHVFLHADSACPIIKDAAVTTTAEKTETARPAAAQPVKKPSTRLAQKMLPDVDPHSALLPPDRWVLKTAYDTFKTHKGIRATVLKTLGLGLLGLGAIGAGIVGAVLAPAALPAAGFVAAGLGLAAVSGFVAKSEAQKLQSKYMPDLIEIVKTKYLELKMDEMKRAWKERAAVVKQERAAKKAAEEQKAAEAKAAAERAAAEEAKRAAEKPANAAPEKPAAKNTAQENTAPAETKGAKAKRFGRNLLKSALQKAQAFGADVQEEYQKQKAAKNAGNDNQVPPANGGNKSAPPQP